MDTFTKTHSTIKNSTRRNSDDEMEQATTGNKNVRTVMSVKELNTPNVPIAFSMQGMTRFTAPYATSGSTSDVFTYQAQTAQMLNDKNYQISCTSKERNRGPNRSWDN